MAGFSFRTFRSRNQPRRFPDEHVSLDTPRRRTISAAMAFARRTWIATALAALALAGPAQSAAAPYREYEIGLRGVGSGSEGDTSALQSTDLIHFCLL